MSGVLCKFAFDEDNDLIKDIGPNTNELLKKAVLENKKESFISLKNLKIDPTTDDNWALRTAARLGHTDIFCELVSDKRTDPTAKKNQAFRFACRFGHLEIVENLLLNCTIDPCAVYSYGPNFAIQNHHVDIVKLLLQDERIDPNKLQMNYLTGKKTFQIMKLFFELPTFCPWDYFIKQLTLNACRYKDFDFVEKYLDDPRFDFFADGGYGHPLSVAIRKGNANIVELLLSSKPISDIRTNKQLLFEAFNQNQLRIAKIIMDNACCGTRQKYLNTQYEYWMWHRDHGLLCDGNNRYRRCQCETQHKCTKYCESMKEPPAMSFKKLQPICKECEEHYDESPLLGFDPHSTLAERQQQHLSTPKGELTPLMHRRKHTDTSIRPKETYTPITQRYFVVKMENVIKK